MAEYHCVKCGKRWSCPVTKCIFCKGAVVKSAEGKFRVIGYTQVSIPSAGNEKVPYYEYLLEDEHGHRMIKKSYARTDIGTVIDADEGSPLSIDLITVRTVHKG